MTDRPEDRDDLTRAGDPASAADAADSDGPVDTEDMLDDPELELITDYLMKALPPERMAEVARRLEEDAAFRELAAPLILAWSVPPRWQRHPMPRAELQKHWEDFRRRAGLVQQQHGRRRARQRAGQEEYIVFTRRRLMMMILGLGVILGVTERCFARDLPPERSWAEVAPVVAESGGESGAARWISVGDARVQLEPGARLLVAERPPSGYAAVARLERGAARFVYRGPPAGAPPRGRGVTFGVETATGIVATTGGDFRVSARQDAADVEVFEALPPWPGEPGRVMLTRTDSRRLSTLSLTAGESGRLQRGREPVKLRGAPDGQRATQSQPLQANPSPRSVP